MSQELLIAECIINRVRQRQLRLHHELEYVIALLALNAREIKWD